MLTFKLAFAIARKNIFRSVMTFISVIISSVLLAVVCGFSSTMVHMIKDENDTGEKMVFAILVLVVAVIAIILIRSVFKINFADKVNLLGLLATVGMTESGKLKIVACETSIYALLGSAAGTVIGRFVSEWHIGIMDKQMQIYYLEHFGEHYGNQVSERHYIFHYPSWLLLAVFTLSVIAVAVAAYGPMRRASKLSVINSLKTDVRINVSLREGLFEKVMCRYFGRIGRLAGQNFDNNSSRYRAVSLTLPCAQIVFVSVYAIFMWDNWEHGIFDAYGDPMFISGMTVGYILTALALVAALGSAVVNINGRLREFAVLKSMGMTNLHMFKLMCCESIFIMFHAAVFGLVGSYLSVWGQFQFLWTSRIITYFHFPWREWFVFVGIDAVFCLFFAMYATLKIRRINIVGAMK